MYVILVFILILLYFIPLEETYIPVKIAVAIMVIAYGLSLGAFKKRAKDVEKMQSSKIDKEQLKKVEKELEAMDNQDLPENN